ncbi:UDP-N-acetylmuramoylalanyl-D-glutamate--2,6-diaminopimelate ligase [Oceanicola granulosus HTCC2516]|uniref:UDP-N-acetylmuramoyl-L-alanyl-D-glutamate--2,6-diaminopimelate ligase n=1 Tax=Oceanicola granulosus (strain ATCC BAA-861 / DSM 15982 / KCTC 12143 / HTCC2516) TaxID=314256 RepID=Q2CIJ0_OCEGH|nr:UDP-N-acetylmuramoyl-L-alanyl-D-glutamate--2,6-diaminopimelate ligase [Oceanicola granulosus]EAR52599.1 UDP-N-acetylmuramoylalanyl-D-glutamate--2,6-diaminopimelate ligase [Oceanicola granulosus HTCC2516]
MSSARPEEQTKSLSTLGLTAQGGREAEITGLTVDSREVMPGHLFAALPGSQVHGAAFIGAALAQQAGAILTDAEGARLARDELAEADVALVIAEDPRQTLAQTAALWFGRHPGTVVAVTGTNGKTSVSAFTRQIWYELGEPAVNLGTTGVEGAWSHPLRHTTPDPITLHRVLAEAARQGVTHVAMEASSHGLDQRRLDGMVLSAGGFTNFTQDHLDYHKSFEAYFDAKMALFTRVLADDGVAVVNLDDPKGPLVAQIAEERGQEVIGVGRHPEARLRLLGQRFDATGQELRFEWQGRSKLARLNLIGGFQAENVLLAAGLAIGSGSDPAEVFAALGHLQTVRGRMQLAATRDNGATVFVDYAHTPDAVATAVEALRPHVIGRIVAIVGAGGDRDRTKRPLMGQAAAEHADRVIVTDDNPRSEDPATIRAEVLAGAPGATEVGDRAEAILRGADMLEPGDALLICGKGHETGQIVGDAVLPFDDAEQASVAVAALDGRI